MLEQAEEGHSEDDDMEDPDSEASEKLIEYAGDVLPALGGAMTPQEFAPYFAGFFPLILQKTVVQCWTEAICVSAPLTAPLRFYYRRSSVP